MTAEELIKQLEAILSDISPALNAPWLAREIIARISQHKPQPQPQPSPLPDSLPVGPYTAKLSLTTTENDSILRVQYSIEQLGISSWRLHPRNRPIPPSLAELMKQELESAAGVRKPQPPTPPQAQPLEAALNFFPDSSTSQAQ